MKKEERGKKKKKWGEKGKKGKINAKKISKKKCKVCDRN
jgi:hypothetical protein